jgi:hypothetical protein
VVDASAGDLVPSGVEGTVATGVVVAAAGSALAGAGAFTTLPLFDDVPPAAAEGVDFLAQLHTNTDKAITVNVLFILSVLIILRNDKYNLFH